MVFFISSKHKKHGSFRMILLSMSESGRTRLNAQRRKLLSYVQLLGTPLTDRGVFDLFSHTHTPGLWNWRAANFTWKTAIPVKDETKHTLLLCAREALTGNQPSQYFRKLAVDMIKKNTSVHTSLCVGLEPHRPRQVCAATAAPARRPFGCPLFVQTAQESRDILAPAHAVV